MANYLIRNIAEPFYRQVKMLAAKRGVSVKELIIGLLANEIERDREEEK